MPKPYNRITHTYHATADTSIAFYIWCDSDSTYTAPTITVSATTSDLVFTTDGTTAASAMTYPPAAQGGTSGTIDASDTGIDTFGELADFVNAQEGWHMLLVGAERSETYGTYLLAASATACTDRANAQTIYWDTSAIKKYRIGVTAKDPNGADSDMGFVNEIFSIDAVGTVGGGTITLNITECDHRAGGTETTLYTETMTSGTAKQITPDYLHFESKAGHSLLVSVDGSTHEPTSAYIELRHRTKDAGLIA